MGDCAERELSRAINDMVGDASGTGGSLPVGEPNRTNVRGIQFLKGRRIPSNKLLQLGVGCGCFAASDSTFKLKQAKESQPSSALLNDVQNCKTGPEFFGIDWMIQSHVDWEACPKTTDRIRFEAISALEPAGMLKMIQEYAGGG